jgi:hypothetical protein
MWTQIVGKVRLALAPPQNHWWHVTLYVTARGLTTSVMPCNGRFVEIVFDFIDHQVLIETSNGKRAAVALVPQTVADFYQRFVAALRDCDVAVRIWPMPVEVPSPIRFDEDRTHASYDRAAVERWWRIQAQISTVLQQFRGRFIGKCSQVHFFWGGFDLAVTRFSGRRAPDRPEADAVTREGYSHEVTSAGFWPGGGQLDDAALYAYAAPEPNGFKTALIQPAAATYHTGLSIFVLPYEQVRSQPSPQAAMMDFLQTTYEAGATLGGWNRSELERG